MLFRQIFDPHLAQYTYLIGCQETGEALVIDPERDAERYLRLAEEEGLRLTTAAETHIHADFLSGARQLAERHGLTVYLSGEGGDEWAYTWGEGCDVRLLKNGDTFAIGNVRVEARHTPGHTPEHLSFLITDQGAADEPMGLASGDFVFVGDTGRPDLLETAAGHTGAMRRGAAQLYQSVQKFLALDDGLQVWPGHGAGSACGKALGSVPQTTVGYERKTSAALEAAQQGEARFTDYVLADQPEPPLYFARMKRLNRTGPPLLDALPEPAPLSVEDLGRLASDDEAAVLDTRADRAAFMRGHLPGALFAPFGKSFPTLAGSYVRPEQPIYLILEEEAHLDAAVRDLVRVGLDDLRGYATPETLKAYAESGGALAETERIDFEEMERRRHEDALVVDVRSHSEYQSGHVPEARLTPHTRLPEKLSDLPKSEPLLVHCGGGLRAASAVSLLERHGFEAVHVDDRFGAWREAHADAVETEEAPAH